MRLESPKPQLTYFSTPRVYSLILPCFFGSQILKIVACIVFGFMLKCIKIVYGIFHLELKFSVPIAQLPKRLDKKTFLPLSLDIWRSLISIQDWIRFHLNCRNFIFTFFFFSASSRSPLNPNETFKSHHVFLYSIQNVSCIQKLHSFEFIIWGGSSFL